MGVSPESSKNNRNSKYEICTKTKTKNTNPTPNFNSQNQFTQIFKLVNLLVNNFQRPSFTQFQNLQFF